MGYLAINLPKYKKISNIKKKEVFVLFEKRENMPKICET